ncbi:hypothetical protein [Cellulomonas sp.]|uniref:hypothetical protein n=1 Tax=Cellulomonas sp. TaxID=40001 RepID=UPI003BA9F680
MTVTDTSGRDAPLTITRDRDGLLAALCAIDDEGWNGPTATRLLTFVRQEIARPLAIDVGLRGLAASQAESSAWQAAWIAMSKPELRRAASPWGVLWRAAKRAALGEVVAARYGKVERRAWELLRPADGTAPVRLPLSLDVLLDAGWDVTGSASRVPELQELTAIAIRGLVAVGWPPDDAARIVAAVVDLPDARDDPRSEALGWRHMATDLGLQPWQARRLCVALRGTATWRGLFARVLSEGPQVVECPQLRAALRTTRVRRHRSPVLAAQLADSTAEVVHSE